MMEQLVVVVTLASVVAASCETFHSGLCPGSSDCLCTTASVCDSPPPAYGLRGDSNPPSPTAPAWGGRKLGGCPGSCNSTTPNLCPGSSSCLENSGACGGSGGGCLSPAGSPCACTGKPASGNYYLTSFDGTTCSCGSCHEYGEFFTADRQRFGCGSYLTICRQTSCVKARVTDYGPSCFVENDAGGPVLDASPAICQALFSSSSCGWSDHFTVHVSQALAPEEDGIPLGPFTVNETSYAELVETGVRLEKERGLKMVDGY